MICVPDTKVEKRVWRCLRKYQEADRRIRKPNVYHVSDLLYPRKAYFDVTGYKPASDGAMGYFLTGRMLHSLLQAALGKQFEEEVRITFADTDLVVVGHIDLPLSAGPTELKSTRKWTIPDEADQGYIKQLQMYCAGKNVQVGFVVVLYICPGRKWDGSAGTKPQLRAWRVTFSTEELEQTRQEMRAGVEALNKAITTLDHKILPLCPGWMCGRAAKKVKVKGKLVEQPAEIECQYYESCQPEGRYPAAKLPT